MSYEAWRITSAFLLGLTAATAGGPLLGLVDWINDRFTGRLADRSRDLGIDMDRVRIWMRWWWAAIAAVGLFVALVLRMPPVAGLACLLLAASPRPFLRWMASRRQTKFRDQMVTAARALAAQFRAGLPLAEGLRAVARESRAPIRHELMRCVSEYDKGEQLADTLTAMKDRLNIEAVSLFVVALLGCEQRGGKVTDAMENISRSLEQLQRVEFKRDSNTSGGRMLVLVLSLFPMFFAGMFYLMDPVSTSLVFSTFWGQLVLCVVIVLTYVSVRWAFKILAAVD